MGIPAPRPRARLPLATGTTAAWAAGRAALAFFPGLAAGALGLRMVLSGDDWDRLLVLPFALAGLLLAYAWFYARLAWRERASDLLCFEDGFAIEGGGRHGVRVAWTELTEPFAKCETDKASRLVLWRLPIVAIEIMGGDGDIGPDVQQPIWRMAVWRDGRRQELAVVDRPIEARSVGAAVETIEAIAQGRHTVEHAPQIATACAKCAKCGAPLVPDDAATVVCVFCKATVPLDLPVREQAAAAMRLGDERRGTDQIIARLLRQPQAAATNRRLAAGALLMFGAWPLGWGAVAMRVERLGLHWIDVAGFLLPVAAVLAGFFLIRARLVDRGAMRLLTLGFGALAPARDGEPARCRMCQAPLPGEGPGGVVRCRYCQADNIAGIDLRPIVDALRGEQKSFDAALAAHRRERLLWTGLAVFATLVFAAWLVATWRYTASAVS